MQAVVPGGAPAVRPRRFGPGLVVAAVVVVVWRALPLARAYLDKLVAGHSAPALAAAAAGAGTLFALLWLGLLRRPRAVAAGLAAFGAATAMLSGNAGAAAIAALLLAATFCAGDLVTRVLRGADAGPGDLASVFAAGLVVVGLAALLLGEAGLLTRGALAGALAHATRGTAAQFATLAATAAPVAATAPAPRNAAVARSSTSPVAGSTTTR